MCLILTIPLATVLDVVVIPTTGSATVGMWIIGNAIIFSKEGKAKIYTQVYVYLCTMYVFEATKCSSLPWYIEKQESTLSNYCGVAKAVQVNEKFFKLQGGDIGMV